MLFIGPCFQTAWAFPMGEVEGRRSEQLSRSLLDQEVVCFKMLDALVDDFCLFPRVALNEVTDGCKELSMDRTIVVKIRIVDAHEMEQQPARN